MTEKHSAPSYACPDAHAVAIVGMAIQAPGGPGHDHGLDTEDLFQFLQERGSGVVTVPEDRWNAAAYLGTGPGKIITDKGAFLPDVGLADPQEFGISTKEAAQMSPLQLHSLHVAFEALQQSGINYRGTSTGVFMGCTSVNPGIDYDETNVGEYYCTGASTSIVPNRISYVFDLTGPSLPVDTACSSSLVAMHLATQAIRNGDCDQALVGGVSFVLYPLDTISFSHLGVLSPDGVSKSFDASANGYSRGEVAGAIVVKRHDLAVRDGDHILATLVGSALTTCGSLMGSLTSPNPEAQTEAIRKAYVDARLKPSQVDFVELHGTGTKVGDRVEANAAGAIFSAGRDGRPVPIGSIKSNIGHGEMGAYVSSLVKVVMMLQRKVILPNGFFETPSPHIDFERYALRVPTAVEPFVAHDPEEGLIASISSYGFGGSCGHTVLRDHEPRPVRYNVDGQEANIHLFAIGALSPRACNTLIEAYATSEYVSVGNTLLSEHTGVRARQMPWRSYAIGCSISDCVFPAPQLAPKRARPTVFCFSGQGPQHAAMGKALFARFPVFRESVLASDDAYKTYTGRSFIAETGLFLPSLATASGLKSQIWPATTISVGITMFQIAMTDLLEHLGVHPDVVIGHSIGETAAFYASRAMPREMVIQIAIARGLALRLVDGAGSMLAVSGCTFKELEDIITAAGLDSSTLHVATLNTTLDFGVSGETRFIDRLHIFIKGSSLTLKAVKLRVSTAVHSPLVDPCERSYRADLEVIFERFTGPHTPKVPVVSTVTGKVVSAPYTIDYLWSNLRQPVQFSSSFPAAAALAGPEAVAVEIAPHPVLSQYMSILGAHDTVVTARRKSVKANQSNGASEVAVFLKALGDLLVHGHNSIDFRALNGWPQGQLRSPQYPFNKKKIKFAPTVSSYLRKLLPPTRPLNSERLRVSAQLPEPWMADHVIDRSTIISASTYLEMALEFPGVTGIWDCHFDAACALDDSGPASTLEVRKTGHKFEVLSSSSLSAMQSDMSWARTGPVFDRVHSHGKLAYGLPQASMQFVDVEDVIARCSFEASREMIYEEFQGVAQFGPSFRRINKCLANDTEVISWIQGPTDLSADLYVFHPAVMDAIFQTFMAWQCQWAHVTSTTSNRSYALPRSLGRGFRNDGSTTPLVLPDEFRVYSRLLDWTPAAFTMNCYVLDNDGTVLFTFEGLHFQRSDRPPLEPVRFTEYWQERALPVPIRALVNDEQPSCEDIGFLRCMVALDSLASHYTSVNLAYGLPDAHDLPFDRQRYLDWALEEKIIQISDISNLHLPPEVRPLQEITDRIGKVQQDIFLSSTAAVSALFSDSIMSQVYELPPFQGPVFDKVVQAIVQVTRDAFDLGRKVVRVLEIGAGTGRLTHLLGEAFIACNFPADNYIDFVCTDISVSLAQEAAKKSPWDTLTAQAFDVTRETSEQGLDPASFDIIVAFDVLHAMADVTDTLMSLERLLVPGGCLAVVELDGDSFSDGVPGTYWMNYIFGSFREWFAAVQGRSSYDSHCTLTMQQWDSELASSGFINTIWMCDTESPIIRHIGFMSQTPRFQPSVDVRNLSSVYNKPTVKDASDSTTSIFYWNPGDEMRLVAYLKAKNNTRHHTLWLHGHDTPAGCALVGLARTIRHEFPLWRVNAVMFKDMDRDLQHLYISQNLLPLPWVDPDLRIDEKGSIYVSRIVQIRDDESVNTHQIGQHETFALEKGVLKAAYPSPIAYGDVEIAVDYIAMDSLFKSLYEFTGIVAVNSGGGGFNVGQRVYGLSPDAQTQRLVCPLEFVSAIPEKANWDLPTLTSIISLATLGRMLDYIVTPLSSGKKVLLHGGGNISAAAAMCKTLRHRGLDIFLTCNVPSQLEQKIALKTPRIYHSNATETWVANCRKWAPEGIDFILYLEPDETVVEESINLLNKIGTIVWVNIDGRSPHAVPLLKFAQRSIVLEPRALIQAVPNLLQTAFTDQDGALLCQFVRSVTVTSPSAMQSISDADYDTARLVHFGSAQEPVNCDVVRDRISFNPRRAYVIIGGIGGLGIALAHCLVEKGARHIILTSRSGEKSLDLPQFKRERLMIQYLKKLPGVAITLLAADCTDEVQTRLIFADIDCAGIFYMPVRLADALIQNMDNEQDWKNVYRVKIQGLCTLLRILDFSSIDFVLATSSLATVTGSPGQANYTAAQTWMEAVVENYPKCVAITVPPITDGGIFVRSLPPGGTRNAALDKYVHFGMTGEQVALYCIDAIRLLSRATPPSLYIPDTNWKESLNIQAPYTWCRIRHLISKDANEGENRTDEGPTIKHICANVLGLDGNAVDEDLPLSSYGLDSLTSVRLSTLLKATFGLSVTQLQLLGGNMTISRLNTMLESEQSEAPEEQLTSSQALQGSNHPTKPHPVGLSVDTLDSLGVEYGQDYEVLLQNLHSTYPSVPKDYGSRPLRVLLTGATGFLGAFALRDLLEHEMVMEVVCLVRCREEEDALDRLRESMCSRGLWNESWVASSRVRALKGDLSREYFGLAGPVWHELSSEIDSIVLSGALVHWVYPYAKLRSTNVLSTVTASELASIGKPKFVVFVSSTTSIDDDHYMKMAESRLSAGLSGIPESDELEDAKTSLIFGYAQSKWVSERLLFEMGRRGLSGHIVRPGFVIGDSMSGVSNTDDFIWRLIKGCIELGYAPQIGSAPNMVPVNHVTRCIVLSTVSPLPEPRNHLSVLNIIPKRRPTFDDLQTWLVQYGFSVERCEYAEWCLKLEQSVKKGEDNALLPLLDYAMKYLPRMLAAIPLDDSNTQALLASHMPKTEAAVITCEMLGKYLAWFMHVGFISTPSAHVTRRLQIPDVPHAYPKNAVGRTGS